MRKIFLIRHGAPQLNGRICLGRKLNPSLSPLGREQVKKLKAYFKDLNFEKIYTSPLKRCVETAEILLEKNSELVVCHELHEIDMGVFEGFTFNEIREKFPEEYRRRGENIWDYAPFGGESFSDCIQRVKKAFLEICKNDKNDLLIVAHGGVNRGLIYDIAKGHEKNPTYGGILEIPQPYASLNCIEEENGEFFLSLVGKEII
ncbi:MAG: histidine phosphatase family protein [Oscillospiraceae bacterium]